MEDGTGKNHMSRYSSNYHHHHHHHQTPSSHRSKHPTHITSYNQQVTDDYGDDDDDDDDSEDEELEDIDQENIGEEEDEYEEEMYQKKRKWKSLSPGYEYTPRVSVSEPPPVVAQWAESTTSVLLDVWGDKILQLGRKSLRAEEWNEVAKKVSQLARMLKTDSQCRHRLDTLKKKYKKEKLKVEGDNGYVSKWAHFKKMDMLMMSSSSKQREGLSCGLDSGEYVFTNSDVYLNCSNGMDEMRDSPENSELSDGEKRRFKENGDGDGDGVGDEGFSSSSFRLLADSIQKFGEIYQKIEESKRQQMQELEKMRMEFHRDLELQKRQMLEQAQAEIEKLQQSNGYDDRDDDGDGDEVDVSAENRSE